MNLRALMFLGFAGFVAQPAFAQTAPTTTQTSPATTQTSIDSILGAGYEIKAVTVLSDATTKEVYTGQAGLPSQVFITLQKGTSVAVCEGASSSWIWLSDAQMTDATRCFKR